jgi:hypothetical protein
MSLGFILLSVIAWGIILAICAYFMENDDE